MMSHDLELIATAERVDFFRVFLYDRSICSVLFDPLLLTLGEFQAWDWLGIN